MISKKSKSPIVIKQELRNKIPEVIKLKGNWERKVCVAYFSLHTGFNADMIDRIIDNLILIGDLEDRDGYLYYAHSTFNHPVLDEDGSSGDGVVREDAEFEADNVLRKSDAR